MGEQEEIYNGGVELLWEYRIPKTVVNVMGLCCNKLLATDESISVMRQDGGIYFMVGMDCDEEYDTKTGLHIMPKAVLPAVKNIGAEAIDSYEDTLCLLGVMKGDVVIAAQISEQPEVPTEVYVTTPKVYLKALQKLKKLGYVIDNTDALKQYVEIGQRTVHLGGVKDMSVESEVDLC